MEVLSVLALGNVKDEGDDPAADGTQRTRQWRRCSELCVEKATYANCAVTCLLSKCSTKVHIGELTIKHFAQANVHFTSAVS